jgi:hypothetical protein
LAEYLGREKGDGEKGDRFKIQEAKNCENVAFLLLSLSAKRCKSPE